MEETWVQRLHNNEEAALRALIAQYSSYVYAIIRNFSKGKLSPSDIEELTADVFIRLWNSRQQIREETLSPYLAAIARNCTKNRLGKQLPNRQELESLQLADEFDICRNAEQAEAFSYAVEALQALPPTEREILVRFYFYGEKATKIAAALSLTSGAVRVRLHRGRVKLRHTLEERGYSYAE